MFAGLRILVRSAVDACLKYLTDLLTLSTVDDKDSARYKRAATLQFSAPSLAGNLEAPGVTVADSGMKVSYAATAELKRASNSRQNHTTPKRRRLIHGSLSLLILLSQLIVT